MSTTCPVEGEKKTAIPSRVNSGRFGQIQVRYRAVLVKAGDERADTERPDTTALGVPLLHTGDVFCQIPDRGWIFNGQAVRLGLDPGLVDEDPGIGVETGEAKGNMGIDLANLGRCDPGVLEFQGRSFLAAEDDDAIALYTDGTCT